MASISKRLRFNNRRVRLVTTWPASKPIARKFGPTRRPPLYPLGDVVGPAAMVSATGPGWMGGGRSQVLREEEGCADIRGGFEIDIEQASPSARPPKATGRLASS